MTDADPLSEYEIRREKEECLRGDTASYDELTPLGVMRLVMRFLATIDARDAEIARLAAIIVEYEHHSSESISSAFSALHRKKNLQGLTDAEETQFLALQEDRTQRRMVWRDALVVDATARANGYFIELTDKECEMIDKDAAIAGLRERAEKAEASLLQVVQERDQMRLSVKGLNNKYMQLEKKARGAIASIQSADRDRWKVAEEREDARREVERLKSAVLAADSERTEIIENGREGWREVERLRAQVEMLQGIIWHRASAGEYGLMASGGMALIRDEVVGTTVTRRGRDWSLRQPSATDTGETGEGGE